MRLRNIFSQYLLACESTIKAQVTDDLDSGSTIGRCHWIGETNVLKFPGS